MPNELRDQRWWDDEDKALANKVMRRARDIAADQQWRRSEEDMFLRLYSESEWRGVHGIDRRKPAMRSSEQRKNRLSLNVCRNCSNAAVSMIVRSRPYVSFQTDGADFSLLKKSRKRERFVQAHFIRERIHQTSHARVRNGIIFGTGGTKVIREGKHFRFENILPGEMLVDEQEGIAGDPPCIYQAKRVDKLRLAELYPAHREAIMKATAEAGTGATGDSASQCLVVYAWHFRSTLDTEDHDGWEVLCVDGATLYKRPYRWRNFPGTHFRWGESPFGWHGTGVVSELVGIQYEINTLLKMIRESTYFGGNVKILAQKGSNIAVSQLSNSLKIPIIEHTGARPSWVVNDVASPQIFQHLVYLEQRAYNVTGISQLDAQSQTPAATMSGRARLVHQNNESLRFKEVVERYENGYIELAEALLQAATDALDEDEEDATVIFRGHEHLEEIKLSDVKIDEEDENLDITAWSSSQLAQSAGARMEQVDFLVANKYIPQNRGLVMMDLGNDFRAEMDIQNAPYNLIDERIERMVLDGEPQSPTPYMDLAYAKQRTQLEIQRCEMRKGVPEERIDMLREFWQQIIDLELKAKSANAPAQPAAAPPPPGMPPGVPPGAPMPGAEQQMGVAA